MTEEGHPMWDEQGLVGEDGQREVALSKQENHGHGRGGQDSGTHHVDGDACLS